VSGWVAVSGLLSFADRARTWILQDVRTFFFGYPARVLIEPASAVQLVSYFCAWLPFERAHPAKPRLYRW